MKRLVKYGLILGVLLFVITMGFSIRKTYVARSQPSPENLNLTGFSLLHVSGETLQGLADYSSLVVIYFHSGCSLCTHEMEQIRHNISQFGQTPLLFVSSEEETVIRTVAEEFGLNDPGRVAFYQDQYAEFAAKMGVSSVPETFVFDHTGGIRWHFKGPARVQSIIKHIDL